MLPNHSILKRLPQGHDTQAMFAREPLGKLVVFVHGFAGRSISTWSEMHQMLPLRPEATGWDIVFYGYRSTKGRAQPNADLLRQFIRTLTARRAPELAGIARKTVGRDLVAYDDILIVAHSLGAPISRQAVLDGTRAGEGWANATRLLLFAPAHRGAHLIQLAMELIAIGLIAAAAAILRFLVPVLNDLDPNSAFITELQAQTAAEIELGRRAPLVADSIIFAEFDRVVETLRFGSDPASQTVEHQTHISVCKACEDYTFPLDEVVRAL